MKFFNARKGSYHTNPILIDEAIYTPYAYDPHPSDPNPPNHTSHPTGDLLGIPELVGEVEWDERKKKKKKSKFDATSTEAEIFLFEYGTVVIWGMTEAQEKRFLSSMYVPIFFFPFDGGLRWTCTENASRWRSSLQRVWRWKISISITQIIVGSIMMLLLYDEGRVICECSILPFFLSFFDFCVGRN